jgi:multidrug efflux pump subunit AcrA (membrane-fusion protein)
MKPHLKLLSIVCASFIITSCAQPEVTQPKRSTIIDAVFASGQIISDNEYVVTANTQGFIIKSFHDEGDIVSEGDPLFHISSEKQTPQLETAIANYNDAYRQAQPDSPQLIQLQLQINQAEQQLAVDEKNYQRYASLLEEGAVSEADFEKIQLQHDLSTQNLEILKETYEETNSSLQLNLVNAKNQLDLQQETNNDYIINATQSGRLLDLYHEMGDFVNMGQPIAKIGGENLILELFVAEEDILNIRKNQKVFVSLNTNSEVVYIAMVNKIMPSFSQENQSFIIEAEFLEEVDQLYPGTQLQANIIIQEIYDALVIPSTFLVDDNEVILKSGGRIQVQTGIKTLQWVEILDGIDTSDQLIVAQN